MSPLPISPRYGAGFDHDADRVAANGHRSHVTAPALTAAAVDTLRDRSTATKPVASVRLMGELASSARPDRPGGPPGVSRACSSLAVSVAMAALTILALAFGTVQNSKAESGPVSGLVAASAGPARHSPSHPQELR